MRALLIICFIINVAVYLSNSIPFYNATKVQLFWNEIHSWAYQGKLKCWCIMMI